MTNSSITKHRTYVSSNPRDSGADSLYVGHVDSVSEREIAGWAIRTDDVQAAVTVVLTIGDHEVARANTGLARDDVSEALGTSTRAGFLFQLSDELIRTSALRALRAIASSAATLNGMSTGDQPVALGSHIIAVSGEPEHVTQHHLRITFPHGETRYIDRWLAFFDADESDIAFSTDDTSNIAGITPTPQAGQFPTIAYYLPQYHPIQENDEWWGPGYTEWSSVATLEKQYPSHCAPNIPADLGFYDLRLRETRMKQADLARQYGIYGFCYHYYWFSGRKLLERPLQLMLEDREPDLPFCLCWANEPWSRRWDGSESELLIAQTHDPEDDANIFIDLLPYFRDKRYIRIDGKPLFIIYRLDIMKDAADFIARMRRAAVEHGFPGLYVGGVSSFGVRDTRAFGCDTTIEFPPHNIRGAGISPRTLDAPTTFHGKIFDYADVVANQLLEPDPDYPSVPAVMPRWDNSARKKETGHIFHGSTPGLFEAWLRSALQAAVRRNPRIPMVFINSWNEWSEGAHLEPDRRFGRAYLDAVRRCVSLDPRQPEPMLPPDAEPIDPTCPTGHQVALHHLQREVALLSKKLAEHRELLGRGRMYEGFPQPLREVSSLETGFTAQIDRINECSLPRSVHTTQEKGIYIAGWLVGNRNVGAQADSVTYLILTRPVDRRTYFAPILERVARVDVAMNLGFPTTNASVGFQAHLLLSGVDAGTYSIKLVDFSDGSAYQLATQISLHVH